ncbi:hypothetical protein M413DRAFT_277338 [Hebeloma cylindrosporum]|uniref:Uncharacterized protein n=1 Tax=Hebeloma cylindrosporum TaxID=76867 RepID=A0A0C3C0W7_HEBCY|nr:hypothetical protein M413DRAFT_277338 [Hebeloma cylindrosporum h7]
MLRTFKRTGMGRSYFLFISNVLKSSSVIGFGSVMNMAIPLSASIRLSVFRSGAHPLPTVLPRDSAWELNFTSDFDPADGCAANQGFKGLKSTKVPRPGTPYCSRPRSMTVMATRASNFSAWRQPINFWLISISKLNIDSLSNVFSNQTLYARL